MMPLPYLLLLSSATRQSCSVWLKNRVQSCYVPDSTTRRADLSPVPETDRVELRANILPLLAAAPSRNITVQLAATLKTIISHDFPDQWPNLLADIKLKLNSNDIRQVHAGCVATVETVRAFRFVFFVLKSGISVFILASDRFRQNTEIRPHIVSELFPTLVSIASRMMQTPPSSAQEIPTMLHLIIKAYKTSISSELSPHQQSAESIVPWGQLLFNVVNLSLPRDAVPEDEEERESCEWWKAKKWSYAVLGALFHRCVPYARAYT